MKRIVYVLMVCMMSLAVSAQQPVKNLQMGIAADKTTFLIFPYHIKHVDHGTQDVLVEQVENAKNILMVKAGVPDFKVTNITVVTEDGGVYPFEVHYESNPVMSVFQYPVLPVSHAPGFLNEQELEFYSKSILNKDKSVGGLKNSKWGMKGAVKGIYYRENTLFFQLSISNSSTIDYAPENIHFYIKDKKKSKRTARQDIELKPVFTYGDVANIQGHAERNVVYAFDKFTIPEAKYLNVEIVEKNGGRNLVIGINNGKIIKALVLPAYD